MKILVVGEPAHFDECRRKLGKHEYTHAPTHQEVEGLLSHTEVVFDFLISDKPEAFSIYAGKRVTAFLNTWSISLALLARSVNRSLECTVFGFNGFPTLFNRESLEVTVLKLEDGNKLKNICDLLQTSYLLVDDRIGLVTPRVICMIINEAYYTVEEGTATRDDIDLAMKLGTNYPYGPFEWCKRIGLKNVYRLLQAMYDDTKDERYKISALMKKEYLRED